MNLKERHDYYLKIGIKNKKLLFCEFAKEFRLNEIIYYTGLIHLGS